MTAPRYVAVKVNDRYETRRADAQGKVACSMMTAGGGLLALYGLWRRDVVGAIATVVGGGLVYSGITGRDPLHLTDLVNRLRHRHDLTSPSHAHDDQSRSAQKPQDEI